MSTAKDLLHVCVRSCGQVAPLVRDYRLEAADGSLLPAWEAGAHIDLHLDNGLVRSYSLLGDPADRSHYRIGVRRDDGGRGGSLHVHQQLGCGQSVWISAPRNAFALDETAGHSLLLAGGIGITPLLAMARRLSALGKSWDVVYCGRQRDQLAYIDELQALCTQAGARLTVHSDQDAGGPLDIAGLLAGLDEHSHAYCCGPAPMLDAFRAQAQARPAGSLHWEYFAAAPMATDAAGNGEFQVQLARSGGQFDIPAGRSILDVLLDAGMDLDYGCMEGVCGACRTPVLSGSPLHRDFVLSDAEKAAGDSMMVCCSRSRGGPLVLDL